MSKSAIEILSVEFARLLQPLAGYLGNGNFPDFIKKLGWEWPESEVVDFTNLLKSFEDLTGNLESIDSEQPLTSQIQKYYNLFGSLRSTVSSINDFKNYFPSSLPISVGDPNVFFSEVGKRTFDFLVCQYLQSNHPILYSTLVFLGIVQPPIEGVEIPNTSSCFYSLELKNLSQTIGNPMDRMKDVYRWGDDRKEFDGETFLRNLEEIMLSCGIPTDQHFIDHIVSEKLGIDSSAPVPNRQLHIPLYEIANPEIGYTEAGFSILSIPKIEVADKKNRGFAIVPFVEGELTQRFDLGSNLSLNVSGDIKTGIAITILPDKVDVCPDIYGTGLGFNEQFNIELSHGCPEGKIIVFGEPEKTRFEYEKIATNLKLTGLEDNQDLIIEFELSGASIIIEASDGDGFIQKILPQDPARLDFDFALAVSRNKGIQFKVGAGLEFTFNINQSLGPIFINTINLKIEANDKNIVLVTAISGSASIGPVAVMVEKIGLKTALDLNKPGLLGNADLSFGFKSPDTIGLSLDTPIAKGGGFLANDNGNYSGGFTLDIKDTVSVDVIGILTTRMPDGTKTFSLKIFGFAEFAPIQLGLGFILTGVGMAIALESSMNEEALKTAVYNGTLNTLLFPEDIIKNAPQIVSNLNTFFPPQSDYYVFGAMMKIGWGGVASLVNCEVGIFIETGKAQRIALIGIIDAALPNHSSPLIILHAQVLGVLNFDAKTLAIDATLAGSKLMGWNLDGDIALRSSWGDNPRFAFSAGGFYPGYRVPQGFPALRRLSITLSSGNPRIGIFTYLALTENSFQCGAMLLFHWEEDFGEIDFGFFSIGIGLIELDGGLSFDVLFKFNPFYFEAMLHAWLSLKRNGDAFLSINLHLVLSGPNNYHAIGSAEFEICCIGFEIEFDETFGDKKPELPQEVLSPVKALEKELANSKNWNSILPAWGSNKVVFRKDPDALELLDPIGAVQFRQKAVPLNQRIQKFGQAAIPPGEDQFDIVPKAGAINDIKIDAFVVVQEHFAPAEFLKLSDYDKISYPPFIKYKAGLQFSSDYINALKESTSDNILVESIHMDYETKEYKMIYETNEYKKEKLSGLPMVMSSILGNAQRIAGKKIHNSLNKKATAGRTSFVKVEQQKFTVATSEANGAKFKRAERNGEPAADLNYSQARQYKEENGAENIEVLSTVKV